MKILVLAAYGVLLSSAPLFAAGAHHDPVSHDVSLPGGYKSPALFARAVFPQHRATRIDSILSLFERIR